MHNQVRILALVCDEGSTGWAFFLFLANRIRMRVIFIRDPLHRLSNLFTNGLRSVLRCFEAASRMVVVARYRLGPCGTGRFWAELCETLRLFLKKASLEHPLIQMFHRDIARDHGIYRPLTWPELRRCMCVMLADKVFRIASRTMGLIWGRYP